MSFYTSFYILYIFAYFYSSISSIYWLNYILLQLLHIHFHQIVSEIKAYNGKKLSLRFPLLHLNCKYVGTFIILKYPHKQLNEDIKRYIK